MASQQNTSTSATVLAVSATPTIIVEKASATEGANLIHKVTFSSALTTATSYDFSLKGDTADSKDFGAIPLFDQGVTYDASTGKITVPAGVKNFTVTYATEDDQLGEAKETVTLTIGGAKATGTILDDEPSVRVGNAFATEGASLSHVVTLSAASKTATSYDFNLKGNTATDVNDFTNTPVLDNGVTYDATTGKITVPAGVKTFTVKYATVGDTTDEVNETTTLTIGGSKGTGTINDDDAPPTVSVSDAQANESAGTMSFTISLSALSGKPVTVHYNTSNGAANSASAGFDYTKIADSVTFAPGETTKTITVSIVNDKIDEANEEKFNLNLVSASNATIAKGTGVGTITDDDNAPTITSVSNATATEGARLVHTVNLSNFSAFATKYDFSLKGDTANAGADFNVKPVFSQGVTYDAATGKITVEANITSFTVTYASVDDKTHENSESTVLTIGGTTGTGTINDNDNAPTLTLGNASATEGASLVHTVELSNPSAFATTYDFSLKGGTADGTDFSSTPTFDTKDVTYDAATGKITVAAGVTSFKVSYTTVDDKFGEGKETTVLTIGGAKATGTIVDNEPTVVVGDATTKEGGNLIHTVTLSEATKTVTSYDFSLKGLTATDGKDFSGTPTLDQGVTYDASSGKITVPVGVKSFTVTYGTVVDADNEVNETTALTIGGAKGVGTITDNDAPPSISISDGFADEAKGTMTFTVSLSAVSGKTVSVDYYTVNGTAVAGSDYSKITKETVTFNPGDMTKTITVAITNDKDYELKESFDVRLTNAKNATISDGQGVGEITSDDALPTISVGNASVTEGGKLVHTVSLSNKSSVATSYDFSLKGENATEDKDYSAKATFSAGVTYDAASGKISVAANVNSFTVSYATKQDNIDENDETIALTIGGSKGIGTISDNDNAPTVTISNNAAIEGTSLVHVVTLSNPSAFATSYDFSLKGATATESVDFMAKPVFDQGVTYDANTGKITVPEGVTSFKVSYATLVDQAVDEPTESVILSIGGAKATGTIIDDDGARSGDKVILGTNGDDVFVWKLADHGTAGHPTTDRVVDFNVATGDKLDIRDLLQGEQKSPLGNYLHFEKQGADTVLHVSSTGGFSADSHVVNGSFTHGAEDKTIVLQNVDLIGTMTSDHQVLLDLVQHGKLLTDV